MTQVKVGWRSGAVAASSLWNSIYSVYNADSVGSSSLKTSLFAAYNGESNANDSFGTNNGTAQGGLTYTTGKIGNAFQFNGTNAYVQLPNTSNQFNFTGDFSVSMWFRSSNLSTSKQAISNYKGGGNYGYGWLLYYSQAGGFAFDLRNGNNINQVRKGQTILTNTWYHVVAVRKTGQIHKLYVNGVDTLAPQTDGNVNNIAGYTANQPMDLGGISDINIPSLCDLDGINIWQKELTQSEITELYNSGNGAQYIGDNFYKPTTNDALGTNNGTAQGGLTYGVGKVGTAFQFNGTNAYVSMGDVMDVGTSSWSYSFWFNTPNAAPNQMVFSKSLAGSSIGRVWSSVENNRVFFNFQADSSNIITIQMAASNITNNTWYHVVLVLDRTDKLKMYINGGLYPVTVGGTNNLIPYASTNYNTTHPFRIGSYTSSDNTTPIIFFNGKIDAFNAWNRVLTQSEVTELYNSGNGKQYPN